MRIYYRWIWLLSINPKRKEQIFKLSPFHSFKSHPFSTYAKVFKKLTFLTP